MWSSSNFLCSWSNRRVRLLRYSVALAVFSVIPMNIQLPKQMQTSDLVVLQQLCFFITADRKK